MSQKYDGLSIKPDTAQKLRDLAKLEKHTLSDQLDIIIAFYSPHKQIEAM